MRIFISHASVDKPLARKLREELMRYGIDVWIDEAEIRVGQSIPGEIQRALQCSDILCILLSSASTNSKWVARELNSFLPLFIDGSRVLVPCRVDSSPLPSLIQDIKYADFTGGFGVGIADLLSAVKIREEVIERKQLEAKRDDALAELSDAGLSLFLDWADDYVIEDCEYDDKEMSDLEKLVQLGLVDREQLEKLVQLNLVDRNGSCRGSWYELSDEGKAAKQLINSQSK